MGDVASCISSEVSSDWEVMVENLKSPNLVPSRGAKWRATAGPLVSINVVEGALKLPAVAKKMSPTRVYPQAMLESKNSRMPGVDGRTRFNAMGI